MAIRGLSLALLLAALATPAMAQQTEQQQLQQNLDSASGVIVRLTAGMSSTIVNQRATIDALNAEVAELKKQQAAPPIVPHPRGPIQAPEPPASK